MLGLDLRPADARDPLSAETNCAAGDEAEPGDAVVLLTLVQRDLQSEADAEHGASRGGALTHRVVEPALAQACHRRAGGADPGKNRQIRVQNIRRRVGRDHLRAEPAERKLDRANVACAIATDRHVHRIPFVDGTSAPSCRSAVRSARPVALNAASAT